MSAPGMRCEYLPGQEGGEEVAVHEAAVAVDEEAAIGVAVPRDPQVGCLGADLVDHELPVLGQQRIGLVVGEVAVRLPVARHELEGGQPLEHGPDHRARHAVAAVEHHLERPDRGRIDGAQRALAEGGGDVDRLGAARRAGGRREAGGHERPDLPDAGVARQRQRALAHELRARVGLRVVRRRAHQSAVERLRADEEIQHLRADHSGVEHVRALRDHAVAIPAGELGSGQAHVAPEPDPQRARLLPAQAGEHAHEGAPDELGDVAVDLLAVEPADVIGLEDLERDRRGHGRRG